MSAPSTARDGRLATVAGAVLTGGASTRMGRDKARATIGGIAAAARVAAVLDGICEDVLLVGGDPPPDAPGRRIPDPEGPRCALRGLVTALEAASAERVLVVATDLPLVTPDLLLALVAWPAADAVVPVRDGYAQPLCALYRREAVLPVARARYGDGELALRGLLEAVETARLERDALQEIDPDGMALANVNTQEELARVEAWLDRRSRR